MGSLFCTGMFLRSQLAECDDISIGVSKLGIAVCKIKCNFMLTYVYKFYLDFVY